MAQKSSTVEKLLIFLIFTAITLTVYSNLAEQRAVDHSKLPSKVENSNGFQKWLTNLKNKDMDITADEFILLEENEIYNSKWMKVYSIDEEGQQELFNTTIDSVKGLKKTVYSPSKRQFLDYRNETRNGYKPNEVHYYGLRDDKIIDARILDCSTRANCLFDRAYFLDNDVFVISEISRNIDKKDINTPECPITEKCTYTFKTHVIDLNNNKRLIYESKPFEAVLSKLMFEL